MDQDGFWSSSHHIHIPTTRKQKRAKQNLEKGYVLADFLESPRSFHMILPFASHCINLVARQWLVAREAEKCSLYSKRPHAHLKYRDSAPAEEEWDKQGQTKVQTEVSATPLNQQRTWHILNQKSANSIPWARSG